MVDFRVALRPPRVDLMVHEEGSKKRTANRRLLIYHWSLIRIRRTIEGSQIVQNHEYKVTTL
jgi:hypothetical protein